MMDFNEFLGSSRFRILLAVEIVDMVVSRFGFSGKHWIYNFSITNLEYSAYVDRTVNISWNKNHVWTLRPIIDL